MIVIVLRLFALGFPKGSWRSQSIGKMPGAASWDASGTQEDDSVFLRNRGLPGRPASASVAWGPRARSSGLAFAPGDESDRGKGGRSRGRRSSAWIRSCPPPAAAAPARREVEAMDPCGSRPADLETSTAARREARQGRERRRGPAGERRGGRPRPPPWPKSRTTLRPWPPPPRPRMAPPRPRSSRTSPRPSSRAPPFV